MDPISSQMIEEQPNTLKEQTTIVVVTHLFRQAHRLANHVIFFWMGKLVESGAARNIFSTLATIVHELFSLEILAEV